MENEKTEQIKIGSRFTIKKNAMDLIDKNHYLVKDGVMTPCPFLSSVSNGQLQAQPCGSFCLHFNLVPMVDKENKPTGKICATLTCGSIVRFPISDIVVGAPVEEPKSNLTIEKK